MISRWTVYFLGLGGSVSAAIAGVLDYTFWREHSEAGYAKNPQELFLFFYTWFVVAFSCVEIAAVIFEYTIKFWDKERTEKKYHVIISKITKWLLIFGAFIAAGIASVASYAAWDHNPQNVYTENPHELLFIFYMWLVMIFSFFQIMAIVLECSIRFWLKNKMI